MENTDSSAATVDVVSIDKSGHSDDDTHDGSSDAGTDSSDDWPLDPNVLAAKFGADFGEKVRIQPCTVK